MDAVTQQKIYTLQLQRLCAGQPQRNTGALVEGAGERLKPPLSFRHGGRKWKRSNRIKNVLQ